MTGFVYILSNPAFPHLIKIGKSERDPVDFRSSELYTTGVPQQFVVEYYAMIDNYHFVESECHSLLDAFRPNKGREFFEYPIPEAISLIRRISFGLKYEKVFYRTKDEIRQAEERHQREIEAAKNRKEQERKEREKQEQLRLDRKNITDDERRKFINSELSSTDYIPSIAFFVFGVLTIPLLIIGFGDGELWCFIFIGLMWCSYWLLNNQRKQTAEQKARNKFPYH